MTTDVPLSPILVADDNSTDLFFLQHRLNSAGVTHALQHVEDGAEAIRVLEEMRSAPAGSPRPWLLFLDLKMPRVDGFEVLDWIRRHDLSEQITVAVLSTSDEPQDIERAYRLGAHRFLVKYPRPSELSEVVAFALARALRITPPAVAAHT
jgi:CheY-like chemotaxis protein